MSIVLDGSNGITNADGGTVLDTSNLASQVEAEAGTSNTTLMTPLRSKQAVTAQVGAATANLALGAVGTYAWLGQSFSAGTFTAGTTYSGGGLVYAGTLSVNTFSDNTLAAYSAVSPSGTWRAVGSADSTTGRYATTIFLRIA